jgi:tRNA-specific 2-thiouridylase
VGTDNRILVALSGGVDSAVAATLLKLQGHDLVAVFMRNGVSHTGEAARSRSCCSQSDALDARRVATALDIPFYVQDLSRPFAELMDSFSRDYVEGRTPNPCVLCNNDLKFGELLQMADDLSCDGVASGHYARIVQGALCRALDSAKDQSYLLHGLTHEQLRRARFPIGHLPKTEVRRLAREHALPVADKPDSADICFVPGGDYRAVVEQRMGSRGKPGLVVDQAGAALASHGGVAGFTVGQRRGLGVALGTPAFVTAIDPVEGTVQVGSRADLAREDCRVDELNWHQQPQDGQLVDVQLRHHHRPEPAQLELHAGGGWMVRFLEPSESVTPGQYAVFYKGDRVLGGGRIAS